VLLAAEDLESIEATLELLADTQAQLEVREAQDAYSRGEYSSLDELQELIDERKRRESGE
jgi:antitoxin YefM